VSGISSDGQTTLMLQEQNERLAGMLREARDQMIMLKLEVDRLSRPPSGFGLALAEPAGGEVEVWTSGRKLRVNASQLLSTSRSDLGHEVALNEDLNAVGLGGYGSTGEVVTLLDVLADGRRGIVATRVDGDRVVLLAAPVRRANPYPGDKLLIYPDSDVAVEILPALAADAYMTEGSPSVSYADLAGLTEPAVELADCARVICRDPAELAQAGMTPPRGILLYGPEGCGKATLAKAFANSLGVTGGATGRSAPAILIEVRYPNLLDKYVGEIERRIRIVFKRAREMARRGFPVVVFFPRIDILPTVSDTNQAERGIHLSVPLIAAEINSLHKLDGRVVVVATSRRPAIDSMLLGPGRLEMQIEVARPRRMDAREILARCLTAGPGSSAIQVNAAGYQVDHDAIEQVIDLIYDESSCAGQIEVTPEHGQRKLISFPDLISRALLHDIASRAKTRVLIRDLAGRNVRLQAPDLTAAARATMEQTLQVAATSGRYDWSWLYESTGLGVVSARRLPAEIT
jgi:proteasome-associated ATPase